MSLLILGLVIWVSAHWFKRLAPEARSRFGNLGKGLVAAAIVASLGLIIMGYRNADFIPVWSPPSFFTGINNLGMLLAFWVYGASAAKGAKAWPAHRVRHPQLLAVKIWAVTHLLVNGDLASIILFGGILVWAGVSVALINRAEPDWTAPDHAGRATYVRLGVITLVLFSLVALLHSFLGVWPFST